MKTLEEIKKIVMENAKKGKFTTTKYVGPYEYKSGFDNYFALSFNKKGEVIVYSFYENDRGEHIDTYSVELSKLDEKVLNEVYENINTKDEKILRLLDWHEEWEPSLFEHNEKILLHLGIIKPKESDIKQKEVFELDEKSIPKLESKKDAYFITRTHKIGVLKCTGETPRELSRCFYSDYPELIYEFTDPDENKGVITALYEYGKMMPFTFGTLNNKVKNKGCFAAISRDKKSDWKYIFVPTKDKLVELFNKANAIGDEKDYYIINTEFICCFKCKDIDRLTEKHFVIFSDKNEALKKFEEFRKELNIKLDDYLKKSTELLNARKELLGNNTKEKRFFIEVNKLKVGDKFVSKADSKNVYTIVKKSGEMGTIYLEGGGVVYPTKEVLPCDKIEDYNLEREYEKLRRNIKNIGDFIDCIKHVKKELKEYTPIVDDDYVFSVNRLKERYEDITVENFSINK